MTSFRPLTLIAAVLVAMAGAQAQAPPIAAAPVAGYTLPATRFLGFGSANTAKTTGAVAITTSVKGRNLYAVGCSGNFANANWSGAVTDSAGNTYVQLGASSGTYPQANSTTQVCVPFIAVNALSATTATFTISGSSSANTTVTIMVWDLANTIPSLAAVDGQTYGVASSTTTITAASVLVPSHSNELVIAAGCASTGTISLPSNSALTFDAGSNAIASGSNCATAFGASAVMGEPTGITGSFTDGSSAAYSMVIVTFKGYALTDTGLQHLTGSMQNGTGQNALTTHPLMTAGTPGWGLSSNPGTGVTASVSVSGLQGRIRYITGWCFGINGDATGAAAQQTFTVQDTTASTTFYSANVNNPTGVGAIGRNQCVTPPSPIPIGPAHTVAAAFGGNTAHALEEAQLYGFDQDVTNIVY